MGQARRARHFVSFSVADEVLPAASAADTSTVCAPAATLLTLQLYDSVPPVAEATFTLAVGVYDAPYLGGQRTSGTSLFAPIAGNITAAAMYNTTLSAGQVAAVSSAMAAL